MPSPPPPEGQRPVVWRPGRVLAFDERDRGAAVGWHHAYLEPGPVLGRERDPLAVRGPIRLRGTGHAAGPDGLHGSARGGHFAQRPAFLLLCRETNPFPVRRPAG